MLICPHKLISTKKNQLLSVSDHYVPSTSIHVSWLRHSQSYTDRQDSLNGGGMREEKTQDLPAIWRKTGCAAMVLVLTSARCPSGSPTIRRK